MILIRNNLSAHIIISHGYAVITVINAYIFHRVVIAKEINFLTQFLE